jgi:hypothetical protein
MPTRGAPVADPTFITTLAIVGVVCTIGGVFVWRKIRREKRGGRDG